MNITKKNNFWEIICFIIFCLCVFIVSFFHEPWLDEFQAWSISKDSLYNILFTVPHLEGHPQLWHLILKCFSAFKLNPEIGIRIPNFIFIFTAVWLLIFKSPFPKAIRLALPFTYFLFYQYAVISRPYSIFCLAMFLTALFYKERNEHPFKFISSICLLCLSSAYGMIFGSAVILVWFIEIIKQKNILEFFKDKRFYAMFIVFLLCLILSIMIFPDPNAAHGGTLTYMKPILRSLYFILIMPIDALYYNLLDYGNANKILLPFWGFTIGIILGLITNIFLFFVFKSYKKLLLFYIPYLIFIGFCASVYIYVHHIGLLTVFYIFAFWCALSDSDRKPEKGSRLYKILIAFITLTISIQIFWSMCSYIYDIKYPYTTSRLVYKFIKENNFENNKIMTRWVSFYYFQNKKTGKKILISPLMTFSQLKKFQQEWERKKYNDFTSQYVAIETNPYFDKNIFYNFNVLYPDKQYSVFKMLSDSEEDYMKQKLREQGLPDIVINYSDLSEIFDKKELSKVKYILIKNFDYYKIWKNGYTKYFTSIYLRDDLYKKSSFNKKPD